jgi:hypothetical protein
VGIVAEWRPVAGSYEHGDELSGPGSTEFVRTQFWRTKTRVSN